MNESAGAPRFIFEGVGSRGDVVPLLTLAAELVRRGHPCRLLANEHFGGEARAQGIEFVATTQERVSQTGPEGYALGTYLYPALDGVSAYFRRPEACDPGTVVVNIDRWAASEPFAEARGLPTVRLHLSPFKLRSLVSPAWPLGANACGLLAETYRTYTLPELYRAFDTDPKVLAHVNQVRARVGLPRVLSALCPEAHVAAQVALFPTWFAAPAADWPDLQQLGFPLPRSLAALPQRLLEFLRRCSRPLVFTPGTNVGDPERFFEAAADCVAELGTHAIFLSPFASCSGQRFGDRIIHFEHIELEPLLPHCSLLVHHGGIGTTARALQAGLPQIITPAIFDQFDNARRVEALGLGRVLQRADLTGSNLAETVRELLGDPSLRARLQAPRAELALDDAITSCADLLEAVRERRALSQRSGAARRTSAPPERVPEEPASDPASPAEITGGSGIGTGRPIVMVLWPELGHFVSPLALAHRLTARGRSVLFAGAPFYRARVQAAGFEFVDLSAPPGRSLQWSVFSQLPGREALPGAVSSLIEAFDFLLRRHDPSLVLIDSLYSALSLLAEARGVPWATYETDLPRELDLGAPPPVESSAETSSSDARSANRRAWADALWQSYRRRRDDKRLARGFAFTMDSYFPDALCAELRRQLGVSVQFERRSCFPPIAVGPRLVLCSRELDFERVNASGLTYLGPCIDVQREQPDRFPWRRLPAQRALVYCSLGTQSLREPHALAVLHAIVRAFSHQSSSFLVVVCPEQYAKALRFDPRHVLVVNEAPQLDLLARAALCIHHGGFNTVKECAFFGVPQLVVPLSHDQFRNAALVRARGIGQALNARALAGGRLMRTVQAVLTEPAVRERCLALESVLERANHGLELEAIIASLEAGGARSSRAAVGVGDTERCLLDTVYERTGADAEFSAELDRLVGRVRKFMGVPAAVAELPVRQEFERLRTRLDTFRVEFRARHAEVVRSQVPATRLPELVSELERGNVGAFQDALELIRRGRTQELECLRVQMANVPLYGPPRLLARRSSAGAGAARARSDPSRADRWAAQATR